MLMDIRAAFESLVKEAKWMDDKTRKEALLKVEAMGHMIGFPQNLLKHGYLEDLYSELKVEKGMFLKSVVNIHTVNANKALKSLTSPQQRRHNISSELPDPFVVNAYNVITHNFIVIPSGILRVPLYGLGLEALNYGAIGFVLAHELTHSFDNKGRTFDKEGEQKNWWTQNTTIEFNKRADCFKKQYGSYKVQDRHINGRATLGENIADNGGLRESIRAYRNYVNRNGKEQKLPGLEHLSHEQLLYLSFANVWCQSTTKQADILLLQDVHSPAKYRVIGTLSNMEDFSEAWSCPAGSNMNPKEKCVLW
ncbi:endothelin-converting enzyme homolog [Periplaneta americana]|uniref:endothelin-converting enzyme homolog n=1 Tax=Periplaneta americana TaxID=6978 RepID=UPI0037E7C300